MRRPVRQIRGAGQPPASGDVGRVGVRWYSEESDNGALRWDWADDTHVIAVSLLDDGRVIIAASTGHRHSTSATCLGDSISIVQLRSG